MIKIDTLKNHPQHIPALARIYYEVLGQPWIPGASVEKAIECYKEHLNESKLPITYVALDNEIPQGMCSLRDNDGIRPDLTPWLGSLVVSPTAQKQGIAQLLINAIKQKAIEMEFEALYLFALDPTIPHYYARLGWQVIGVDNFKNIPVTVMKIAL